MKYPMHASRCATSMTPLRINGKLLLIHKISGCSCILTWGCLPGNSPDRYEGGLVKGPAQKT